MAVFNNVAISGKIAVGSTTLARALALKLGWNLREASQMFRDISQQRGFDLEKTPQQYNDDVDRKIDQETVSICQSTVHTVVVSDLAGYLTRDISHTLRVLVTCDDQTRVKRYAVSRGHGQREAAELLRLREQKDQEKFVHLYRDHDFFDPVFFHLVLDSGTLSVEEEVTRIVAHISF